MRPSKSVDLGANFRLQLSRRIGPARFQYCELHGRAGVLDGFHYFLDRKQVDSSRSSRSPRRWNVHSCDSACAPRPAARALRHRGRSVSRCPFLTQQLDGLVDEPHNTLDSIDENDSSFICSIVGVSIMNLPWRYKSINLSMPRETIPPLSKLRSDRNWGGVHDG
jgi:hypothetical protein